jgi:hypothetical protein
MRKWPGIPLLRARSAAISRAAASAVFLIRKVFTEGVTYTQTVRPRAAASCVPCHFLPAAPERPFASLAELKHKSPPRLAAGSRRQSLRLRLRVGLFPLKQSGDAQECAPRNNRHLATFVPVLNGRGEGRFCVWRPSADACAPGLAGGTPISWGTRGRQRQNHFKKPAARVRR